MKPTGPHDHARPFATSIRVFAMLMALFSWVAPPDAQCHRDVLAGSEAVEEHRAGSAVATDGTWLFVGAPGWDVLDPTIIGKVYVYTWTGTDWVETQVLDNNGPRFGKSLSLDGNRLAVGAKDEVYVFEESGGVWSQHARLSPTGAKQGFGTSVAIHGDWLAVGAPESSTELFVPNNDGAGYIFHWDGSSWVQEAMVEAPVPADVGFDATHEDRFGHGVAIGTDGFGGVFALFGTPDDAVEGIASIGFNTIFVAGVGNVDISENEAAPGAAYVYERINNSWQLETTLQPSGSRDADHFGWDLASRNNLVVIGAPGDSVVGTNGGSAWVFQRTPDRNWTELETLLPFDGGGTGTSFGTDVAISANEIVIGALWPYGDSGLAFAFEKQGTSRWDPFGKIVAPVEDEAFGISVAVGPLLAVVGAPKRDESLSSDGVAYTFELGCTDCDGNGVDDVMEPDADGDGTTDACDLCPTGPDYLDGDQDGFANACDACEGFHDALDADLDGVPDSCDADRCAGQWIGTPSLSGGDSFGAAMDLDFETLVVGSPGAVGTNDFEGAVHVLVLDDAGTPWIGDDTWPLQATLTMPSPESGSRFGSALAVSGDRVVAGAPDANAFDGRALTWDRSGTFWGSPVELDPAGCTSPTTAGAQYGYSVAAAGSISVVSSPGDGGFGGVRVFDGATCIATLIASDAEPDDNFGSSVAVSGNGDWILIGANYRSTVADADGSVYVFRRTGPSSWVEHDRIEASNGRDYANFGQSVAIDDDGMRAVVGAPLGDSAVQRSGAGYVLVREENGTHGLIDDDIWYEEQRLPVIGAGGGAYFGSSVDIGPGVIAVGLPYPQFGGAVHVFTQIQGTWYRSLVFGQPSDPRVNRYGDTVALGTDWIFGGAPYSSPIGLLSGVVLGVPLMAYYDTDGDFTPDTCDICPAGDDGFDADADGTPDACDICPAGDDGSDTDADGVADACDACPGYDDFEDFDADGYADGCDACLYGDDDADADGDGAADACDKCPGEDDTVDGNGNGVPDGCETVAFEEIRANDATAEDHFGKSVAVDGINAVIGAPEADLFDSVFGLPGSAYVFRLEGPAWTRWVQKQKLTASDAAPDHAFGQSVAIDGNAILVGAPLAPNGVADPSGAAYLFRDAGAGFAEEAKLIASDATTSWLVGWDVALDGDLAVAGAPWADIATTSSDAPGAAYVFRHAGGGLWNQEIKLSASSPTGGDWYGASVAVRGDVVAVGASQRFTGQGDDGRVFVYRFNGSSWIEEDVLTASDAAANDRFGTAVVLGDDILVVGADGAAKAYLYVYDGVDWNEVQVLTAPEPSVLFGARVALDDKRLLISGLDGKVFLFRYDSVLQQAEPVTTIASQDLVNGDNYGFAADVSGDAILVGAHQHAHPGTAGGGSVYAAIPGDAADCDGNGVPDVLELSGTVYDCDGDLVLDVCSVTPLADSDGDGVSDGCDIAPGQDDDPDGDGLAGPIIVDPEWTLVESVIHRSPVGGHFSPLDDKLYFGQRYGSPVGLYRIEPSGEVTALHTGLGPAGLVIDQDGDVYMSTDGTGAIYRHAYNSWTRQTWVTGFHSGDDDPQGMAIAPDGYTGSVVSPGEGLIMDHGFNGPDEIWRWNPDVAEGETALHSDNGTLVQPQDVAIGTDKVWAVDGNLGSPGIIYEVGPGGSLTPLATSEPIGEPAGIAIDPTDQSLLVFDTGNYDGGARVVRVVPATGQVTTLITTFDARTNSSLGGIDVSSDGSRIAISDLTAHRVYEFRRTCPGDADSDFDGVCDDSDACPGSSDGQDADDDGVPDGCDDCPGSDDGVDSDLDGVADACDVCAGYPDQEDTDGDGTPDGCEPSWCELNEMYREDGRQLGESIAAHGSWVVSGSTSNTFGIDGAFLFRQDSGTYAYHATLTSPAGTNNDDAGLSVAIHGDWIAVGAPRALYDLGGGLVQTGHVSLFRRTDNGPAGPSVEDTWDHVVDLIAPDASAGAEFGRAVDLGNGILTVGAHLAGYGAAYVFDFDGSSWNFSQKLEIPDPDVTPGYSWFGYTVELVGDRLAVGAPKHRHNDYPLTGGIYLYRLQSGFFVFDSEVQPSVPDSLQLGYYLAFDGATILSSSYSSSDQVYVYVEDPGGWVEQAVLAHPDAPLIGVTQFGVAIAVRGNAALIGAPMENPGGSTLVYERSGNVWSMTQKLRAADASSTFDFGRAVELYRGAALVGDPDHRHTGCSNCNGGTVHAIAILNDCNGDEVPDACSVAGGFLPDADNDWIPDACDSCLGNDGLDRDFDGVPDACDACPDSNPDDSDFDGVCDDVDLCDETADPGDSDQDGWVNSCDLCPGFNDDPDGDGVQGPCVNEPGWLLSRAIPLSKPAGVAYNPLNGLAYAVGQSGGDRLHRINADGTKSVGCDVPGLTTLFADQDPSDGAVFGASPAAAAVYQYNLGSFCPLTWVSGFPDITSPGRPFGMTYVPPGFAGGPPQPTARVVGKANDGSPQVWAFETFTDSEETVVSNDPPELTNPLDVTAGTDGLGADRIFLIDRDSVSGSLFELMNDGSVTPILSNAQLPVPTAVTFDPVDGTLLVATDATTSGLGRIARIDISNGATVVGDVIAGLGDPSDTGIDITQDGTRLLIADRLTDHLYEFVRGCPAGPDSDGDGVCDSSDLCLGFDDATDQDLDGVPDGCESCPTDPLAWGAPGEVTGLTLSKSGATATMSWSEPGVTGSAVPLKYDVLQSGLVNGFVSNGICVENRGTDLVATDSDALPPGAVRYYLTRAANTCIDGTFGTDSQSVPRSGHGCP